MTWIAMLAVGIGSFALRLAPLIVLEHVSLSERLERMIRYAGSAVMAALIATSVQHSATGSSFVPTMLAMAVTLPLAARQWSMIRLLLAGGAVYAGTVVAISLLRR